MARIAAVHLGLDRGVAAAPEARQIARHLHRPVRRRQEARSPAGRARRRSRDGGRGRTAPARGSRSSALFGLIVDRHAMSPVGAAKCVGASASSRRRRFQRQQGVQRLRRTRPRSTARAPSCRRSAARAIRPRCAQAPRPTGRAIPRLRARRRNMTRSRHCRSALVQGSRRCRARATPRASARAVSSFGCDLHRSARRAQWRRAGACAARAGSRSPRRR